MAKLQSMLVLCLGILTIDTTWCIYTRTFHVICYICTLHTKEVRSYWDYLSCNGAVIKRRGILFLPDL